MSPQFVDFDADGTLDIVAGIFDGSPHVALGSAAGFAPPVQILDRDGRRIVMNQFWNFDTGKWDETKRCDPDGRPLARGHLTSAWATDWDADGDLDLLLGDHDGGHVLLRLDEGTAGEHRYAGRNTFVLADGEPLVVAGTVTTLRTVDWDGDGLDDLLVGSMGEVHGDGPGGAVHVYRNHGSREQPLFAAPTTLVAPSARDTAVPVRPDVGLYMDVADQDGDGDLDLVVGGYSHWTPPAPTLDAAQRQRVEAAQAEIERLAQAMKDFWDRVDEATAGLDEAGADARRTAMVDEKRAELAAWSQRRLELLAEIEPLVGGRKQQSFVWLYENRTR